jgi:hypothetical protein
VGGTVGGDGHSRRQASSDVCGGGQCGRNYPDLMEEDVGCQRSGTLESAWSGRARPRRGRFGTAQ